MVEIPVPIGVGSDRRTLVGIRAQIENPGNACFDELLAPYEHGSLSPLLCEYRFPVVVAQRNQVAVIGEVEEFFPRALLCRASEIGHQVVAIEMYLERLLACLMTL